MDPNELLTRIRMQSDALLHPHGLRVAREELAKTLARNITELDAYLTAGGMPPEAWREGPDAESEEFERNRRTELFVPDEEDK